MRSALTTNDRNPTVLAADALPRCLSRTLSERAAEVRRYAAHLSVGTTSRKKMSVLLAKGRALWPVLIVMLGLVGLWLGSHSQFWLGLIAFMIAFVGAAVMSHLDLRPPEQERRTGWQRIRQHGKLRYVGRQVLRGWPVLLVMLAIDLSSSYQSGKRWDPRWFVAFFALMVGGSVLISLGWWYWQERKYGSES